MKTRFYHLRQEEVIGSSTAYDGAYGTLFALSTSNYTPYDLFCFNMKFGEELRRINPDLAHSLVPEDDPDSDRVYLHVQLLHGADRVGTDDSSHFSTLIEKCHQVAPGKFLFLSTHFDIYYQEVLLPKLWLQLVLPRIEFTRKIEYISGEVYDLEAEVIDECLYLRLSPDTDYMRDFNELKLQTLNYLSELYSSGAIALPDNSPLIRKWDLSYVSPGLYKADWTNYLFARNKSDFLLQRALGSETITLQVPTDKRLPVSRALNNTDHFFIEGEIVVKATSLNQALRVARKVLSASS